MSNDTNENPYGLAWEILRLMCTHDDPPHPQKVADLMVTLCELTGIDIDETVNRILAWTVDNEAAVVGAMARRIGSDDGNTKQLNPEDVVMYSAWGEIRDLISERQAKREEIEDLRKKLSEAHRRGVGGDHPGIRRD